MTRMQVPLGTGQAGNITDLDLGQGTPQMIGLTAVTRGVGGGSCPACGSFANQLHKDGKCGKCTSEPLPLPTTVRPPTPRQGGCGGGCGCK